MSPPLHIVVGRTNDAKVLVVCGEMERAAIMDRSSALWFHGELGRALDIGAPVEALRAALAERTEECARLRMSIARHKSAYTRATKRRRARRSGR